MVRVQPGGLVEGRKTGAWKPRIQNQCRGPSLLVARRFEKGTFYIFSAFHVILVRLLGLGILGNGFLPLLNVVLILLNIVFNQENTESYVGMLIRGIHFHVFAVDIVGGGRHPYVYEGFYVVNKPLEEMGAQKGDAETHVFSYAGAPPFGYLLQFRSQDVGLEKTSESHVLLQRVPKPLQGGLMGHLPGHFLTHDGVVV